MTIGPATGYNPSPYGFPQLFHPSSRISLDATDDYPSFSSDEAETLSFQSTQDPSDSAPLFRMANDEDPPDAQRQSRALSSPVERFLTPSSQLEGSQTDAGAGRGERTSFVRYALDQLASNRSHVPQTVNRPMSDSTFSDYSLPPPMPEYSPAMRRVLSPSPPLQPSPERRVTPIIHQRSMHSPPHTVSPQTIEESQEDMSVKSDLPQFIACEAPEASFKHQRLNYKPVMLRLPVLGLYAAVAMVAAGLLIWGGIKAKHGGLQEYHPQSRSQYFLFRFLPELLAGLYLLALQPVEAALTRAAPFLAMSSASENTRSRAHSMPLYTSNYLFPRLTYFAEGLYVVGVANLVLWMSLFTVPLFSALFQIRLVVDSENLVGAQWSANQVVAFFLAGLYLLLAITLIGLGVYIMITNLGLKWFPTTIADLVVMIRHSNVSRDFFGTELIQSRSLLRSKLKVRSDRLGYWRTIDQSKDIFYAIGEEGEAPRRFSVLQGRTIEKRANESSIWGFVAHAKPRPLSEATTSTGTRAGNIHSPFVRFAYIPWYLSDSAVVSWAIVGILLWVAVVAISFVHKALPKGFTPSLPFGTDAAGFSRAGFFYSFIPSLIGMIIYLAWRSVDMTFRALQPWANLAGREGASGRQTLLLDYTQDAPLVVTARAALAGHFRVAIFSFITVAAMFIAILGGGVFQPVLDLQYNSQALVRTNIPAYGVLLGLLTLVAVALPTLFPTRKRYLPHAVQTTGEVISFIYASPLQEDRPFRDPLSKTEMTESLDRPLTGDGPLGGFAFGVFRGKDGKDHLGVDRIWRDESGDV